MENRDRVDCDGGQTSSNQLYTETKPSAIIVEDGRVVNAGVSNYSSSAVVANHCGELENDVNRLLEVVHGCITGKGLMHSGNPNNPGTNNITAPQNHSDLPPEYVETSPVVLQTLIPQDPPEHEEVVDRSGFLGPWFAIERLCSDLVRLNHVADNLDGIMLQTLSYFRPKRAGDSVKSGPGRAQPSGVRRHQRSCKCDKRHLQEERELGSVPHLLPLDGGICRHFEIPNEMPLNDPSCDCRHCVDSAVVYRVPANRGSSANLGTEGRGENCSLDIVNETAQNEID